MTPGLNSSAWKANNYFACVFCLVPATAPAHRPVAERPVRHGPGLCRGARSQLAGVSRQPRSRHRYQPFGARTQADPHGPAQLTVRLDRSRRRARRCHPEPAGDLPDARVNPYTCLVDVLQRIDRDPAKRVIELTPRVCKKLFAETPIIATFRWVAGMAAPPLPFSKSDC